MISAGAIGVVVCAKYLGPHPPCGYYARHANTCSLIGEDTYLPVVAVVHAPCLSRLPGSLQLSSLTKGEERTSFGGVLFWPPWDVSERVPLERARCPILCDVVFFYMIYDLSNSCAPSPRPPLARLNVAQLMACTTHQVHIQWQAGHEHRYNRMDLSVPPRIPTHSLLEYLSSRATTQQV